MEAIQLDCEQTELVLVLLVIACGDKVLVFGILKIGMQYASCLDTLLYMAILPMILAERVVLAIDKSSLSDAFRFIIP